VFDTTQLEFESLVFANRTSLEELKVHVWKKSGIAKKVEEFQGFKTEFARYEKDPYIIKFFGKTNEENRTYENFVDRIYEWSITGTRIIKYDFDNNDIESSNKEDEDVKTYTLRYKLVFDNNEKDDEGKKDQQIHVFDTTTLKLGKYSCENIEDRTENIPEVQCFVYRISTVVRLLVMDKVMRASLMSGDEDWKDISDEIIDFDGLDLIKQTGKYRSIHSQILINEIINKINDRKIDPKSYEISEEDEKNDSWKLKTLINSIEDFNGYLFDHETVLFYMEKFNEIIDIQAIEKARWAPYTRGPRKGKKVEEIRDKLLAPDKKKIKAKLVEKEKNNMELSKFVISAKEMIGALVGKCNQIADLQTEIGDIQNIEIDGERLSRDNLKSIMDHIELIKMFNGAIRVYDRFSTFEMKHTLMVTLGAFFKFQVDMLKEMIEGKKIEEDITVGDIQFLHDVDDEEEDEEEGEDEIDEEERIRRFKKREKKREKKRKKMDKRKYVPTEEDEEDDDDEDEEEFEQEEDDVLNIEIHWTSDNLERKKQKNKRLKEKKTQIEENLSDFLVGKGKKKKKGEEDEFILDEDEFILDEDKDDMNDDDSKKKHASEQNLDFLGSKLYLTKIVIDSVISEEQEHDRDRVGNFEHQIGINAAEVARDTFGYLKKGFKFLKKHRKTIQEGTEILGKGARQLGEFAEDVGLGKEDLTKFITATKKVGLANLQLRAKKYQQLSETYGPDQARKTLELQNKIKEMRAGKKYELKQPQFARTLTGQQTGITPFAQPGMQQGGGGMPFVPGAGMYPPTPQMGSFYCPMYMPMQFPQYQQPPVPQQQLVKNNKEEERKEVIQALIGIKRRLGEINKPDKRKKAGDKDKKSRLEFLKKLMVRRKIRRGGK